MRLDKKGISAIVATVLIILVTVAGVTIIWIGIVPIIKNDLNLEGEDVQLDVVGETGYTAYDPETELVTVQVDRSGDNVSLGEVVIILSFNGTSVETRVPAPYAGQLKTYTIDVSGYGIPYLVRVAPIYSDGKTGAASSGEDIPMGTLDPDNSGIIYNAGSNETSNMSVSGFCGDGICSSITGEDELNCPMDCAMGNDELNSSYCEDDNDCPSTIEHRCSGDYAYDVVSSYVCSSGTCISNAGGVSNQDYCENGCAEGIGCLNESAPNCADTDGGYNIYEKGTRTNYVEGYFDTNKPATDYCKQGDPKGFAIADEGYKVESCSGEDCGIIEYVCESSPSVAHRGVVCPNGCSDGACIVAPSNISECIVDSDCPSGGSQKCSGNYTYYFSYSGDCIGGECFAHGGSTPMVYCENGCVDGACVEENKSSILLVVESSAPVSEVSLMVDFAAYLSSEYDPYAITYNQLSSFSTLPLLYYSNGTLALGYSQSDKPSNVTIQSLQGLIYSNGQSLRCYDEIVLNSSSQFSRSAINC